jgi:hypothetical protein
MDDRQDPPPLLHFRARPRIRAEVKVRLAADLLGVVEPAATTRDLGPGGAFVRCEAPLALGSRLQLRIETATGEPPIEVHAEVAWRTPPDAPEPGVGVRFLDPSPTALLRIAALTAQGELPIFDLVQAE